MTKKRLAVFIDGTANDVKDNTSVWRMYSLCAEMTDGGLPLRKYYTKGVGTSFGSKIRGNALGYGLDNLITGAYQWLIENYRLGDEIFIFGFSRGAYGARSLAGFVAICGILRPGSPVGVGELFKRYKARNSQESLRDLLAARDAGTLTNPSPIEQWMVAYSSQAQVAMVGVWDTVGALFGERGELRTGLRIPIRHAFHAMAIDEHRWLFKPTLYTINTHMDAQPGTPQPQRDITSVEQRWFVGAHANVGGGYKIDLLPQPALDWLMSKAHSLGLRYRDDLPSIDGLYRQPVRNSMLGSWGLYLLVSLGIRYFRRIGAPATMAGELRTENVNETIDKSVFARWRENSSYRPRNLRAWGERFGLNDPGKMTTSVHALDPNRVVAD